MKRRCEECQHYVFIPYDGAHDDPDTYGMKYDNYYCGRNYRTPFDMFWDGSCEHFTPKTTTIAAGER